MADKKEEKKEGKKEEKKNKKDKKKEIFIPTFQDSTGDGDIFFE